MITLTRLNGEQIQVNPQLIECLRADPDTRVEMASGKKWTVRESVEEILAVISTGGQSFWNSLPITVSDGQSLTL